MIIALTLSLRGGHVDLMPADHDSLEWVSDHAMAYSSVCERWFTKWKGCEIRLGTPDDVQQMRDEIRAALQEMFPRIHFVIEIKKFGRGASGTMTVR